MPDDPLVQTVWNIYEAVPPVLQGLGKVKNPWPNVDAHSGALLVHWFNFNDFYTEVKRTIKPNGIIAVIGYGLIETDKDTNEIISRFYKNILGSFWDKERKYIDENYQTIPFPFNEIESPILYNTFEWTFEQLIGYFETWSAVQHYIKLKKENPIDLIKKDLKETWKTGLLKSVRFRILLRIGKVEKT